MCLKMCTREPVYAFIDQGQVCGLQDKMNGTDWMANIFLIILWYVEYILTLLFEMILLKLPNIKIL